MSKVNGGSGGGGTVQPVTKSDGGMDAIQGKLGGMQLDGNGGQPHGNNFFAFPPPTMAIDVDGSATAAVQHGGVSNGGGLDAGGTGVSAAGNAGQGPGMYKKNDGGARGGGGGDGGGVSVNRRYGVPLANSSRNTGAANRGVSGVSGGGGPGAPFASDDRRRGGGGRHGSSMNGGVGVAGGRPRVGYDSVGGPAEQSPLQVRAKKYEAICHEKNSDACPSLA